MHDTVSNFIYAVKCVQLFSVRNKEKHQASKLGYPNDNLVDMYYATMDKTLLLNFNIRFKN